MPRASQRYRRVGLRPPRRRALSSEIRQHPQGEHEVLGGNAGGVLEIRAHPLPRAPDGDPREPRGGRENQRPVARWAAVARAVLVLEDQLLIGRRRERNLADERLVVPDLDLFARPQHGDREPAGGTGAERPAVAGRITAGVTIWLQNPVMRLLARAALLPLEHVDFAVVRPRRTR